MEVNSWIAAPETNRRLIEIPIKPAVRPSLAGIAIAATTSVSQVHENGHIIRRTPPRSPGCRFRR